MLSSRNELILVCVLIFYLAFIPSLQMVRDILATSFGKAAALAGIVYVYKYVSCSAALLLVIAYVRCARSSREMFTTPSKTVLPICTCPDGYAYDSINKECKPSSSMSGSVAVENFDANSPPPITAVGAPPMMSNTMPSAPGSGPGAPVNTMPPNPAMSTAPMTTPTATMPPPMMPPNTSGGVQPSTSSSSSAAPL